MFTCFSLSIGCLVLAAIFSFMFNKSELAKKRKFSVLHSLFAGVFVSAPTHLVTAELPVFGYITYGILALSNDDANIIAAVNLRMYFERLKFIR